MIGNLYEYSESDFDFSQNFQLEQEYSNFKEIVERNASISELFKDINVLFSMIEDTESLKIFQKIGSDTRKIKFCQGIISKNREVSGIIEELLRIEDKFDIFYSNFYRFLSVRNLKLQRVKEAQQYNNIDFQEDKVQKLYEDIGLCNEEIKRIDCQIETFQEYRDKVHNITVNNYKMGGKEELLKGSKILNEDAKEILYQFIQTFEEYSNNSKSWLSNSRSVSLEEEYKRQQEVLIGDLNLSLQLLKIDRDEVINHLHEIEVRISDITSANERLQSEKDSIDTEIKKLNEEEENYLKVLNNEFGELPLLFRIQQKKMLLKSKKDLDSLLSVLKDYNDNRENFIALFSDEVKLQFYSLLFENRLNKSKAKLFCAKLYLEKEGYIKETLKVITDFEVVPKGSWVYYLDSALYDRIMYNENKGQDFEVLVPNRGKWVYLYDDLKYVEKICKKAISLQVCSCIKHSDSNEGVCCFYINGMDVEAHKKVISFFIENGLLKQTSSGLYYDVSFKFDEQNIHKVLLSNIIDLETGKFLEN